MSTWQRARKPEQKEERRVAILQAAKRLFADSSYQEVSLNAIAREAGMSKPNVYRYFASREEIFLFIFLEEQERFSLAVIERLEKSEKNLDSVVSAWVEAALDCPDLLALLPQLGLSMEKNSSVEQLVHFKKRVFQLMAQMVEFHCHFYPEIGPQQWEQVLSAAVSHMAGLWPLCNNNEKVRQALEHPEVQQEPWDFREKMSFALKAMLLGVSQKGEEC